MKIRTITTGIFLESLDDLMKIQKAAFFNQKAKKVFEKAGYEVQTTRISTNSWEDYLKNLSDKETIKSIQRIEKVAKKLDVSFFNIGRAISPKKIAILPKINAKTSIISCSAHVGDITNGIIFENIKIAAHVIKEISRKTKNGYGNFRFCASANCKAGIPFFPTGFHEGKKSSFGIGLECGDLAMKAFSKAKELKSAEKNLKIIFEKELSKIEKIANVISKEFGIEYNGIDASLAPSSDKNESIALAYEKLGLGKFGQPGTLAISAIITRAIKSISIKKCGYSGLMLPVCEDFGLALRANENTYGITNLLLYSTVCGCGLDTVPVPGNITEKQIEAILLDTASLAIKLNKPLSVRLFPVPGKASGEMTNFKSPYLKDCKILKV